MSHSQFHRIDLFILRHAWLNLWDKHMTTGRINQVSHKRTGCAYERHAVIASNRVVAASCILPTGHAEQNVTQGRSSVFVNAAERAGARAEHPNRGISSSTESTGQSCALTATTVLWVPRGRANSSCSKGRPRLRGRVQHSRHLAC